MARSPVELVAPKYLSRFECIGAECEENCCTGWRVDVDRPHYKKLKVLMDDSPADRARFRAAHERNAGAATDQAWAHLKLHSDGSCPMLEADGLCVTHRRFGQEALSNACSIYPRSASLVGDQVEITASMSCPEVARKALLQEDALELMVMPSDSYQRPHFLNAVPVAPATAWERHLDDVRAFVLRLLSQRRFPMSTRLFFVARFAHRAAGFVHKADDAAAMASLVQSMAELDSDEALLAWHTHVAPIAPPLTLAARLIMQVLKARLEDTPANSFRQLVIDVLRSYAGPLSDDGQVDLDPSTVWETYRARRDALIAHHPRIDLVVENYCKNHWLRDWYTRSADLASHQRRLLVRVAVLRFLLHSHPRLAEASTVDAATVDAVAVEVFYKFSRGVEHAAPFLTRIAEILDAEGPRSLAQDIFLLKL